MKFNFALITISLLLCSLGTVYELTGWGDWLMPLGLIGVIAAGALEWARCDNLKYAIAEQQKMLRG